MPTLPMAKIVKNTFLLLALVLAVLVALYDLTDILFTRPTTTSLLSEDQTMESFPTLLVCPEPAYNITVLKVRKKLELDFTT